MIQGLIYAAVMLTICLLLIVMNVTPETPMKNAYPRFRLLPPWDAMKVLIAGISGRHAPLNTLAGEVEIASLERVTVEAPPPLYENISYLRGGNPDGRHIVFVHGTPGNAKGWADYLINAGKNRCYIALDRPGFGKSGPQGAVVSMQHQAAAIKPLLQQTTSKKTILVGHSLGAPVAVQAALNNPGRVGGLLLLAGAFDPDLEEANFLQLLGIFRPVAFFLPRDIENSNHELLALKHELVAMADRLHKLTIPISIMHGDRDPLVPHANVAYLEEKAINAPLTVTTLDDTDHFIPWHSKPSVDAALEQLIDQVCQTETRAGRRETG